MRKITSNILILILFSFFTTFLNAEEKSKNKIVVYSALTNNYDDLISQKVNRDNIDFILFSDLYVETKFWQNLNINFKYRDPRRLAKIFKILPHLFFYNYNLSLWVDANLFLNNGISEIISSFANDNSSIKILEHDKRDCIYKEAKECLFWERDKKTLILDQIKKYKKEKYPINNGLINGRFILRKHNLLPVKNLMKDWWSEIELNSVRDQLSFNYVAWKANLKFDYIKSESRDKYFKIIEHKLNINYDTKPSKLIKLKYILFKIAIHLKKWLK